MSNIIQIKRGNSKPDGKLAPYELGVQINDGNKLFIGGAINEDGSYGDAQQIKVENAINATNAENANKIKNNNNDYITFAEMLDLIYPIDSIYMSMNNTNPANLFGGTWQQLTETFLFAASAIDSNNPTYSVDNTKNTAQDGEVYMWKRTA